MTTSGDGGEKKRVAGQLFELGSRCDGGVINLPTSESSLALLRFWTISLMDEMVPFLFLPNISVRSLVPWSYMTNWLLRPFGASSS